MIRLNAGNLWTDKYLDKVIELNKLHAQDNIRVCSLFGSISKLTPTARSFDRIPYLGWAQIDRFVEKARLHDINIRYTLNASCVGSLQDFKTLWDGKLKEDIMELHNIGVHEWVITSPLLLRLLRDLLPHDFLEVSTIAEVSTPTDALRWKNLGADGVNLSTNINRNFARISDINCTGLCVSMLANEACLYRCPFRRECYNLSSHNSERSETLFSFYPFRLCNEIRINNKAEWLKARMILPQWMKIYHESTGVSWFKIAFRTHPYEVAVPILEHYMNQHFNGNYIELWPTVSHLGNTDEPLNTQYISCELLDKGGFIEEFSNGGRECDEQICGESCRFCDNFLRLMDS